MPEGESAEEADKDGEDGSSPCVDDMSPVKAAQLEMRHPPKIKNKRTESFKMQKIPMTTDVSDSQVLNGDVPSTAGTDADRNRVPSYG